MSRSKRHSGPDPESHYFWYVHYTFKVHSNEMLNQVQHDGTIIMVDYKVKSLYVLR